MRPFHCRSTHAARFRAAFVLAAACTPAASLSAQIMAGRLPVATAQVFHADRIARVDSFVTGLMADRKIPGAVVLLVKDGRVAYHKAFGVRDIETRAPLQTTDLFRLASQTKAITSVAVMMLWEEGRIQLDDPIGRYLPEFRRHTVLTKFNPADSSYEARPTARRITIRQLLTHTSGLDYAQIGSEEFNAIYAKAGITAGLGEKSGVTLAEKMKVLGGLPLRAEPGERFIYSLSIDVLGRLVEVVSGMSLDQFFRTRIFTPLRMHDTFFGVPASHHARLVALHEEKDGAIRSMRAASNANGGLNGDWPNSPVTYFSGGSGLTGTISDYARFLQMVLNGGELDGQRILARKTVEMMLTNQIGTLQPNYGLGFALETEANDFRSAKSLGSFWWSGAFQTTYWVDPKEKLIALLYTNVYGSTARSGGLFEQLVYGAMK